LHCLSGILSGICDGYSLSSVLPGLPTLHFICEHEHCLSCSGSLVIKKVKTRSVFIANYGSVKIREHIKQCRSCDAWHGSEELPMLVKQGSNYSYSCLVQVGLMRYKEKKQISEISQCFKDDCGIAISDTQVRRMAYSFLHYLGKFHYLHAGTIHNYLESQGGYILYVDSTCEGRAPHLLTCIDGNSSFVLYSQKMASENQADLERAFEKVLQLFGVPLCCVHDMGRGINNALDMVFPQAARVICHFHLLRDIGKDLLDEAYQRIKKVLSDKKIYADIRYQVQAIEKQTGGREAARNLFFRYDKSEQGSSGQLTGMLYGFLLELKSWENNGDGYGFPFDTPKFAYYKNLKLIYEQMTEIERLGFFGQEVLKKCRFHKIKQVLSSVLSDAQLAKEVEAFEIHIEHFDTLREIMRIALPGDKKGLNDQGKIKNQNELLQVETNLKGYIGELDSEMKKLPKLKVVVTHLEKYWDKIFARGIQVNIQGETKTVFPHRTNNTSEQFYRRLKQILRRLHGNSKVNKDLIYLPEEIALIENLSNQAYIKNLLKDESKLAGEFAKLDIEGKQLPYEKQDLELVMPVRIKNRLKDFTPLKVLIENNKLT